MGERGNGRKGRLEEKEDKKEGKERKRNSPVIPSSVIAMDRGRCWGTSQSKPSQCYLHDTTELLELPISPSVSWRRREEK